MCDLYIHEIRLKMKTIFKGISQSEIEILDKMEEQVKAYINKNKTNNIGLIPKAKPSKYSDNTVYGYSTENKLYFSAEVTSSNFV